MKVRPAALDDAAAIGEAHAEAWRVGFSDLLAITVAACLAVWFEIEVAFALGS